MREQVELRAYQIWQEAGCPDGSSVVHWLQAEYELGVIPDARDVAGFARLDEVATAAKADDSLQTSVEAAVPQDERLPARAAANPLSEQVKGVTEGQKSKPDTTTTEGSDSVLR